MLFVSIAAGVAPFDKVTTANYSNIKASVCSDNASVVAGTNAPFTGTPRNMCRHMQTMEHTVVGQWECSHSFSSKIKGFAHKFACKCAYNAFCVNGAQL